MDYKRLIKRLILAFISLGIFVIILFFIFIVPNRTLPILTYHSITKVEPRNSIWTLPQGIFKRQMEYLFKHNYHVASLKEVARLMREDKDIPSNWIVLTFDDGYRDFYNNTYPILKKYQFHATLFVVIDFLMKNPNCMSWEQVEQLAKDNLIEMGAHSLSHRLLPLLTLEEAKKEIVLSKSIIEERLKEPIVTFAYPYGALNDSIKEMVKEAGFKVAVGITYQRGQFEDNDIYILKRIFVSKLSKYPFVFRFMLSGYYVPTREFILKVLNIKTPRHLYAAKNLEGI